MVEVQEILIEDQKESFEELSRFVSMEQADDTKEFIVPYSIEEHARNVMDPDLVYLRILNHGALVGFFILGLDAARNSVEFRRIVVSAKGKGIGQEAIKQMEHFCLAELSRSRIWLDVFSKNNCGRHVYEKLGYVQFGSGEHEGATLLMYEKNL